MPSEREQMIEILTMLSGYAKEYWEKQTDEKLEQEYQERLNK
ncbi:hypothetical protein EV207_101140 [Scopulibacillus darangshiensis]|uniref:Uncharacterized protein n=1 Tax=Scopulibacillus darangshiensis TaxID=442528 RepID=A0A4R2PAY7_9BACL|nr:hypothetical protein EV207_101140 [Scopulibacillus darangshiensis]